MKKMITLLALVVALSAAIGAFAQEIDPYWQDQIGIYNSLGEACDTPPLFADAYAYLVLKNMTCPNGLAAFECRISVEGGSIGLVTVPEGVDADDSTLGFAIGLAATLPYSDYLVLAELEYPNYGDQIEFYLHPNRTPSLPGVPVYVDGADPLIKIPMYISSQSEDVPCFVVNGECPVPNASSTWGAVKDLYR